MFFIVKKVLKHFLDLDGYVIRVIIPLKDEWKKDLWTDQVNFSEKLCNIS